MNQVFLAPTGSSISSVSDGVELTWVKSKLSEHELALLQNLVEGGKVRLWGCHKGTYSLWNQMNTNDIILFVPKGLGIFTDYARMAFKSQNPRIAEEMRRIGIWPMSGFQYLFFLKDHRSVSIAKSKIAKFANWRGSPPQRFMRVASPRVAAGIIEMVSTPGAYE